MGNRYWQARTLNNLGYAHLGLGDPERARAYLRAALPLRREVADGPGEATTLRNLGRAAQRSGDAAEAYGFYAQALEKSQELGDRRGEATALRLLGEALEDQGNRRRALAFLDRSLEAQREIGDRREEAEVLERRGVGSELLKRHENARRRVRLLADQLGRDAGAEATYYQALLDLENAEAEIRRASPRYAALTRPEPVSAEEIQGLLGPDTLLLEYSLGEERSFLWGVGVDATGIT